MNKFKVIELNECRKLINKGCSIGNLWNRFFVADKNRELKFPENVIGAISVENAKILLKENRIEIEQEPAIIVKTN